jgi:hypothetical protein
MVQVSEKANQARFHHARDRRWARGVRLPSGDDAASRSERPVHGRILAARDAPAARALARLVLERGVVAMPAGSAGGRYKRHCGDGLLRMP